MNHALTIYWRLLGVQLRSQLQYRLAFFFDIIATSSTVFLEFASLALVFQRFETLGGWTLGEVAFLYGLEELSFGIMDMIFSGFDPGYFGQEIRRGSFDQLLLRPLNLTMQVFGSKFVLRRLGKMGMGLLVFLYAQTLITVTWTPAKLLYLPFVVFGMVCFFGGLFIVGATITFWTVESIEVMNIFTYGGSYLIAHPMHIYQTWLRRLFTYVVPAIFLNYYPALYFLDKPDPFNFPAVAPFIAPLVGILTLLVSLAFWRFGIRFYQSTGN
ncbi:MAG: ABC-2 family transporter protein [Anaerolineales bacterium]|nr:ABC-2 family transporter protein [Anaerolineales bacterium]